MLIDASADVTIPVAFVNPSTGASQNPDAAPTFRIFGSDGAISGGNGTADYLESGTITGFTVASPNVVTSTNHGLVTGSVVSFSGVGGVTGLSGNYSATLVDANRFSIVATLGGAYTSGGVWRTPGLFGCTLDSVIRAGLEAGRAYLLLAYASFSSVLRTVSQPFTVIG